MSGIFDAIGSLFLPQKKQSVGTQPVKRMTDADDPAVREAKRRRMEAERMREGRASTILTGGAGLGDGDQNQRRTLG